MAFGALNYAILVIYLVGMVVIGWRLAGSQKNTEEYFLAGRRMPWLAVGMSMFASLTSAVTYMGLPGIAYRDNASLAVVCLISPLLAPVLVLLFYPFYRRLHVTTSYEYIHYRFGRAARLVVSALFLLARLGWLGTVIYAPALALAVVTGIPLWLSIVLMGLMATLYTVMGGLSAVIWTDVAQFLILVGGAVLVAFSLVETVPGGASAILDLAQETDRIRFNWSWNWTEMTVLGVAVSFFFQMMQDYGTDQVTVQRLLAVPNYRGMVKAVLFNACTDFFVIGLLLFIGLGLFAFYHIGPDAALPELSRDQILPYYVMHSLPQGVSGLVVAAIFAAAMSSMDSGINSMATVIVHDFVVPQRLRADGGLADVRLARILTLVLGLFSTVIAFYVSTLDGLIEAFATFMSLFSAPVLALFLLGMLTRRGHFPAWCVATAVAIPATFWLQRHTPASWVYYFPFSFLVCFLIALGLSLVWPRRPAPADVTIWRHRSSDHDA